MTNSDSHPEPTEDLNKILCHKYTITPEEADEWISQAQDRLMELLSIGDLEAAYNITMDEFGVEPDYITDLL